VLVIEATYKQMEVNACIYRRLSIEMLNGMPLLGGASHNSIVQGLSILIRFYIFKENISQKIAVLL